MTPPTRAELHEYVAHCPSCGARMSFVATRDEEADGTCTCGRRWFFMFQVDPAGTFGVMSFQCDNGDRIIPPVKEE